MSGQQISICEKLEIKGSPDVMVIGGGPAGIGAAVSAARLGLKVLVIEQTNALGGIATSGLHGHFCKLDSWGGNLRVVGGIAHELGELTKERGFGTYNQNAIDFEVEGFKLILEELFQQEKIDFLYYTQFSDVVVEDGKVTAVIIQNKSGRQAYCPKVVIDCSGDADVAAKAGVPFEFGRPEDGATQPMTLMFQLGGVDVDKVNQFRGKDYLKQYNDTSATPWKLTQVFLEAQRKGDMEPFQDGIMGWWWTPTRPDQLGINFTHIFGKNSTKTEDLTYATVEGRHQAYLTTEVYRKYIPGMENSWVSHCAALIGTRESRRIVGEYVITEQDVMSQCSFEDSIGYGSFFIDIHNCTGAGMDAETWRPPEGFKYQIPYRALVPKKVDNMLVAGRCISCTHKALGSLRVMPQCMLEGEACGVAAYEAIKDGCAMRDINVPKLQKQLRAQNAIVFDEDIVKF